MTDASTNGIRSSSGEWGKSKQAVDTKSIYIATLHPSTILRVCDSDGFNDSHLHLFLERRTSIGAHGAAGTANCSSSGSEC